MKFAFHHFHILVSALVVVLPSVLAKRCYKFIVRNNSNEQMRAIWRATGCAGTIDGETFACHREYIPAGESRSYKYKWGTTRPQIAIKKTGSTTNPKTDFCWGKKNGFKTACWTDGGNPEFKGKTPECGGKKTLEVTLDADGETVIEDDRRRRMLHLNDTMTTTIMTMTMEDSTNHQNATAAVTTTAHFLRGGHGGNSGTNTAQVFLDKERP